MGKDCISPYTNKKMNCKCDCTKRSEGDIRNTTGIYITWHLDKKNHADGYMCKDCGHRQASIPKEYEKILADYKII